MPYLDRSAVLTIMHNKLNMTCDGKEIILPPASEDPPPLSFFYSPEIGRTITDPDEIRTAELATMPLDSWLKCIRMTMIPIFTSKQLRLITP